MERKFYSTLLNWKNEKVNKKPLLVFGARQVGKTYIINEFCKKEFKNYKYINLLENQELKKLFESDINSEDMYIQFALYLSDINIENSDSVVFVDEAQESPKFISSLKFFCEQHNNVNIICAGSLLGVMISRTKFSYPVGKIWTEELFPMDFEEFLMALNQKQLIDEIKTHYSTNTAMPEFLHNTLLKLYRYYLWIGGMPESIKNFVQNEQNLLKYNNNIVPQIIESYFNDMRRYIESASETIKTQKIYSSIGAQLLNASKKFQYSKIDEKAKSRDYELSLDWLLSSRLLLKSDAIKVPEIPPRGFINEGMFKIYLGDTSILCRQLNLNAQDVISYNLSLYKGIIAENYVATELRQNKIDLLYWTSGNEAEVDFILYNSDGIIPVEVKASDNTKSKSLKTYVEKFHPKYSIRISTKNFALENNIKSVPLYAVFCIK